MAKITSIKIPDGGETSIFLTFRRTSSGSTAVDVHAVGTGKHEFAGEKSNKVLKMDALGRPWTESRAANLVKARAKLAKMRASGAPRVAGAPGMKPGVPKSSGPKKDSGHFIHSPLACKCRSLRPSTVINMLSQRNETGTLVAEAVLGITGACMYQMLHSNAEKRRRIRPYLLKKLADHLGVVPSRISEPFTREHRNHTY